MSVPTQPKIYHITHLENLPQLISSGCLYSDAQRIALGLDCHLVGMSDIKQRRLTELEVKCHPGTKVGEYAPFYFCPRSIMLYILHRGNNPDLGYRGGQQPILHLQADLRTTIQWADENSGAWAFSDRNAGAYIASFFNRWEDLDKINWTAVQATDFRTPVIKDGKQAEFLIYDYFPWNLVEKIGVFDQNTLENVEGILEDAAHQPPVSVEHGWYY